MGNFLNYTNLSYDQLIQQINAKLAADSRFDNFRESAICKTMVEIFAGCTDLINYYIERRAEESFIDTAKLKSSIILLAKQLGYCITRPIPAYSTLKIKLKGDFSSQITSGDTLSIAQYSNFTYDGNNYILEKKFKHTFTATEYSQIVTSGANYEKDFTTDDDGKTVKIWQGEVKNKIIEGTTNTQVAQNFQIYKIEDKEFSNKFGSEDFDVPITNVYVGSGKNANTIYSVDRISLINWTSIENFVNNEAQKVCVIRTANDENVELLFGDAKFAEIGASVSGNYPNTTYDNIYIDYLATKGSLVNKSGVIGEKVTSDISVYINGDIGKDITSKVEFYLNSNILGGADLEDIESIRLSAPSIYYSLNRLITSKDYVNYLKSLTAPINFKNALAWGEQEELNGYNGNVIDKMFNIVFFCAIGSLYNITNSPYSYKSKNELQSEVLDLDFDPDKIAYQNYFNIFTKQNAVEQLKSYETSDEYYVLYGTSANIDITNLKALYDNKTLSFYYNSDSIFSASPNAVSATPSLSLSAVTTSAEIATVLQNGLRLVADGRGTSADNSNYNLSAFDHMICNWNSTDSRFEFSGTQADICHIINFSATDLAGYLGVSGINSVKVTNTLTNTIITTNLETVIDKLKDRCQLTVKNIYISPIIQKFYLNGTIYVKNLTDKETLHTTIKDAIYKWLEDNADFNVSIYISNITEIIDQYPNVINADIKLVPISATTNYSITSGCSYTEKYPSEKSNIISKIQTNLISYLNTSADVYSESEIITLWSGINDPKTYNLSFTNNINEKTFFNTFAKNVYNDLGVTSIFRDTQDFIDTINEIHKGLMYIIKFNMLDSYNNIAPEYSYTTINEGNDIQTATLVRGGYSLGNECVQIIINTSCSYK